MLRLYRERTAMLLNTFRSELTKLFTTRSVWWTTGVFFFLAIGWTLLMVLPGNSQPVEEQIPVPPNALVTGGYSLAMPVLRIQAVMVVTTEYRDRESTRAKSSHVDH